MQVGRFTIEPLNEGQFELFPDGKINRTPVSQTGDQKAFSAAKKGLVGINPLYVTDGSQHIIVDTGLGWGLDAQSKNKDVSNIRTNLRIFGVDPAQITHVIITHLHYDHAAGLSFTDAQSATRPTFPNAKIYLQKTEWLYALEQVQHQTPAALFYNLDDLYRLYADDYFAFVENPKKEIIPGITLLKTGGHTAGHQAVKISDGGSSAYFLGDLVLSPKQLNYYDVASRHMNRMQVKRMKLMLLRRVYKEQAFLFFYHSLHSTIGQLEKNEDKKYVLKEVL